MGQVGGNGSVVWQNQHRTKLGKFRCKDKDQEKLKKDELGVTAELEVWGRDEVVIGEIGTTPVPDIEDGLKGFKRSGHFLVRLRFDGAEANAIEGWVNATTATPASVKMSRSGDTVVLAFLVKAIERKNWPVIVEDMPWEIRYDW